MHPTLQTSALELYNSPLQTSGLINNGVPVFVFANSEVFDNILDTPKSPTLS